MPSIKKRVSGFIRQFSSPHTTGPGTDPRKRSPHSPPPPLELCFISRYLGGEARPPGPEIAHGKTGYQLPSLPLANLDPEVFAAFTGPSGGLTCIRRKPPEDPDKKQNSEDLDYIDLDGARGVSRRPSVSEAFGPLESLAQPGHSLSQPPTQPPPINGFKDRRSPKPAAIKVPKSPTNCIDNTVMNIRVGDRVYRVDDRSIKSPLSETPPCSMVPEYESSEIVDVDTELDLVETEDGYMPLALARSQGLENPSKATKRVVIKSPVRTSSGPGRRPSSLSLSTKSHASFSSLNSQSSAESLKDSSNSASPRDNGSAPVSQVQLKVSASQSKSTANVSSNSSNPAENDYPELQPVQKTINSPSVNHNNDTTDIINKLTVDLKDDISTSIAGVRYWNRPNAAAYGLSDTLYELHPHTGEPAGSPIADTFALVARKNSCIMVLGDGVNWGARAALASRAAVHGAMDYLNQVRTVKKNLTWRNPISMFPFMQALFAVSRTRTLSTQDVFQILLRSFHAAHCLILEEEAMLTTLTAAVVVPTKHKGFFHHHASA